MTQNEGEYSVTDRTQHVHFRHNFIVTLETTELQLLIQSCSFNETIFLKAFQIDRKQTFRILTQIQWKKKILFLSFISFLFYFPFPLKRKQKKKNAILS